MLSRRIIPCLDVREGRVVKGVRFRDHVDMGDIAELAQRYRDQGADELVFYDIGASPEARSVDVAWIERIARLIDIPVLRGRWHRQCANRAPRAVRRCRQGVDQLAGARPPGADH